jgi:hypothetical protein
MRITRTLGGLALWLILAGFSDPRGYYTLAIPPNWSIVPEYSNSDISDYAPFGNSRRGTILIVRDAAFPPGTTLDDVFRRYRNSDSSDISEESILVAGRYCLHAVVTSHGQRGIPVRGHYLACDLIGTPYPNAKVAFLLSVGAAPGNSFGVDPDATFWSLAQSIAWTKSSLVASSTAGATTRPAQRAPNYEKPNVDDGAVNRNRGVASLDSRPSDIGPSADPFVAKMNAALRQFDQKIAADPSNAAAFHGRCLAKTYLHRIASALADCDEALRLQPNNAEYLEARGYVYLKMNDGAEALRDYGDALKIDPRSAESLYGRGLAKKMMGDTKGAYSDLLAAEELSPHIGDMFKD